MANIEIEVHETRRFFKRKDADNRKKNARIAITKIVNLEIDESTKRDFLRRLLYAWTQAEPKNRHATQYQSIAAVASPYESGELVHEHVQKRALIVDRLLAPNADIENILNGSIACTITREEDKKLRRSNKNKNLDGWERYKAAEIQVCFQNDDGSLSAKL